MRALGRRPKGHEHARAESPSASKKRPGRAAKPAPASAAACRAPHPSLPTAGACRFWELLRLASQFAKAAPRSRRITCVQRAAKADRVVLPPTRRRAVKRAPIRAPILPSREKKRRRKAAPSKLRMRLARPAPCGVETNRQEKNRFFLSAPPFARTLGLPNRLAHRKPIFDLPPSLPAFGGLWEGGRGGGKKSAVGQTAPPAPPRLSSRQSRGETRRPQRRTLRCPSNAVAFRPKRRKRGPFRSFCF